MTSLAASPRTSTGKSTGATGAQGPSPDVESKGRVLVVDDEAPITELLSTALRYMGYEVAHGRARAWQRSSRRRECRPTSSFWT